MFLHGSPNLHILDLFRHRRKHRPAAFGFEMAHNKILDWACAYKGGSPTYSYRIGVADGLVAMARREKKRELEEVRRKELDMVAAREREEAMERQRVLDRLTSLPSPDDSSDADSYCSDSMSDFFGPTDIKPENGSEGKADFNEADESVIDLTGDIEESIEKFIKKDSQTPVKSESTALSSLWASEMQLTRFRATSEQVADDFLKEHDIKLRHSKRRSVAARDSNAYQQGWIDSKNIDFHQKRLHSS
ncbi:uncharacterized protein ATNIH1004_002094 [Aspergillus tanneri]|uniref:Uncharacterized protein n=1 Tax=Aspergillus tanneri TaxID=1220188 RepID=A0A5M9MWZ6_9EURO|nr:uncharacterized protein ATNIH1004_002094 [Aspergillus tanneri]KAA8649423.1 hypothetical protein ATNIH1004_002094 [Aspergillus tanneri]